MQCLIDHDNILLKKRDMYFSKNKINLSKDAREMFNFDYNSYEMNINLVTYVRMFFPHIRETRSIK